jgi:hypothetical protein
MLFASTKPPGLLSALLLPTLPPYPLIPQPRLLLTTPISHSRPSRNTNCSWKEVSASGTSAPWHAEVRNLRILIQHFFINLKASLPRCPRILLVVRSSHVILLSCACWITQDNPQCRGSCRLLGSILLSLSVLLDPPPTFLSFRTRISTSGANHPLCLCLSRLFRASACRPLQGASHCTLLPTSA